MICVMFNKTFYKKIFREASEGGGIVNLKALCFRDKQLFKNALENRLKGTQKQVPCNTAAKGDTAPVGRAVYIVEKACSV